MKEENRGLSSVFVTLFLAFAMSTSASFGQSLLEQRLSRLSWTPRSDWINVRAAPRPG